MTRLLAICAVSAVLWSCGVTFTDPVVYKQIRRTTGDFLASYGSNYRNESWENDNFGRIYHPAYHRDSMLPGMLDSLGLKLEEISGIKIFDQVERKDFKYLKEIDSYLVRHDFRVIAVLEAGGLKTEKPPIIVSQYCLLEKDRVDRGIYKVIDTWPTIMNQEFLYQPTFVEYYLDFTQDEAIAKQVQALVK